MCNTSKESRIPELNTGVIKNTVIIPAFNEELGLSQVLEKTLSLLDHSYEVLVVNDGSTDSTLDVSQRYPVHTISHSVNQGKGAAMMTGIRYSHGENIIFIDADDAYPPEGILEIAVALENYDMAVASRVKGLENLPPFHRIGNAIVRTSIRSIFDFKGRDPLTGLYGLKKVYLENMNLHSRRFGIESEIAIKAALMGLTIKDIPIVYRKRVGQTKLNGLIDGVQIIITILEHLGTPGFLPDFSRLTSKNQKSSPLGSPTAIEEEVKRPGSQNDD